MKTISQLFGFKPEGYVPEKKLLPANGVDPTLLYGIELEIEGLEEESEDRAKRAVPGMVYHSDGSLRNNGGEFVTLPMNFSVLEYVLNQFFQKNKLTEENYSERCSVHVHANCCDLTLEQIRLLLCLYQITERILFNYIKADRKNNIFCVPWSESVLGSTVLASDPALYQVIRGNRWQKYSALNLLPLRTQGTIEFRHMDGTKDLEYILNWCNIIGSMFKYVRENKYQDVIDELLKLNTTSAYSKFMQGIFPGELYDLLVTADFREALEEGVLNMKFMLAEEKKNPAAKQSFMVMEDVWPAPIGDQLDVVPAPENPHLAEFNRLVEMQPMPGNLENARQQMIQDAARRVDEWNRQRAAPAVVAGNQIQGFRWNPVPNEAPMAAAARPIPRRPINRNPR